MEGLLTSKEFFITIGAMGIIFEILCGVLLFVFMGIFFKLKNIVSDIASLKKYEIERLQRGVDEVQKDVREVKYKR